MALRECVPALTVSFESKLMGAEAAQFQFGVAGVRDVEKGMEKGTLADGSVADLTEREAERLSKFRATIVKTLFPKNGNEGPL